MTPEQIALVERTLRAAAPVMDTVAADFYDRLFAADPALRELFSGDPAVQRAKFVAELQAGYGVRAAHYATVGSALLAAMGAALGEAWTEQVEQAWRLAYNLTAEVMIAGAADASR